MKLNIVNFGPSRTEGGFNAEPSRV